MAIRQSKSTNFPHADSSEVFSRQDEAHVGSEGRKGSTREYGNREKKIADLPKFEKGNERSSARVLDKNARDNRGLWSDPDPDIEANRAKAPVFGSGEDFEQEQGLRPNEDWHEDSPGMKHYGDTHADLVEEYQDRIIDKHAPVGVTQRHKRGAKEAYALAPESKVASTKPKRN